MGELKTGFEKTDHFSQINACAVLIAVIHRCIWKMGLCCHRYAWIPDYKGKNVGEALVLKFEDKVSKMGARFVYLTTDSENNKPVNDFYEKLGWSVESEFRTREGRAMRRYWKKESLQY